MVNPNFKKKSDNNQGKILNYRFISSAADLESACARFSAHKIVGVDLEADSMHCFREKICLIQMACNNEAFLIDPFELKNIDPFLKVLEDPSVVKVFHGSDFDIRSLDRDYGIRINNLFDTEIACRFLGVKERGLAALLKAHFDVTADKRFQKEDWSRRPLDPEMIAYSVMDVAYLEQLHQILTQALEARGRLSWALEECDLQARVKYENNHVPPLFRKFKGAGKMDNRTLAVLENMLTLRLDIAREKDRPMFKVFSNPCLKTVAEKKPTTVSQMVKVRALSKKQADMYGKRCCKAVSQALSLSHKELPSYPRTRRPKKDARIQACIKRLKQMRETLSEEMDMEPGFLLNNALITDIAVNNPKNRDELKEIGAVRNWQLSAMGETVLANVAKCR